MIKAVNYDEKISRVIKKEVNGKSVENTYFRTDFVADGESDITAANTAGSEYLDYPAGSCIYSAEEKKMYMLNASEDEYAEV